MRVLDTEQGNSIAPKPFRMLCLFPRFRFRSGYQTVCMSHFRQLFELPGTATWDSHLELHGHGKSSLINGNVYKPDQVGSALHVAH